MKRKISSPATFRLKFVGPMLCLLWLAWFTYDRGGDLLTANTLTGMLISYLVCRHCVRLKEVSVDEDFLYVSDFTREVVIPLAEVAEVQHSRRHGVVKLLLSAPTEFGDTIIFTPTNTSSHPAFAFKHHPAVAELKYLVAAAKSAPRARVGGGAGGPRGLP